MAEESKVRLVAVLDSSAAVKGLGEIEDKAEEVGRAAAEATGGDGGGGAGGGGGTTGPRIDATAGRDAGKRAAEELAKGGADFGKAAGRAIVSGPIANLAQNIANAAFNLSRDPLRPNNAASAAQAGMNGAIGGAASLAALGPWGAAIGALVGGVMGLAGETKRQQDASRVAWAARQDSALAFNRREESAWRDESFGRILAMTGSREGRLDLLEGRRAELMNGGGNNSIANLQKRLGELEDENQTEGAEYKALSARLGEQMGRLASLNAQIRGETLDRPVGQMLGGSDVADSLAAQGVVVGNQVDVASVNQRQLDVLGEIKNELIKFANGADRTRNEGVYAFA